MGAKAKMTDHFQDNDIVDAIAFEPMRRLSAPAVVDGEHINTIENDDDEKILEKIKYEGLWNEFIFRKYNKL